MNRNSIFLIATGVLTVLLVLGIALNVVPFGIPEVWVWKYQPIEVPARLVFPCIGMAVLLGALALPVRHLLLQAQQLPSPARRMEWLALGALWLAAVLLSLGVALLHPWGLMHTASLIFSIGPNSYYYTALQHHDMLALLQNFDQHMVKLPLHAQTQSAGPIVLCWGLRRLFDYVPFLQDIADVLFYFSVGGNSQVVGAQWSRIIDLPLSAADVGAALMIAFFFISVGSLTVVPLYFLGKWLYNARVGVWAAVGFTLLPGFHLFHATVDQMYPFVTTVALCLVTLAVRAPRRGWLYMGAAGVWLSLAIFMHLGLLTLIVLCVAYGGLLLRRGQSTEQAKEQPAAPVRSLWSGLPAFMIGLLAPQLLLWILFHYNLIAVLLTSNRLRDALYAELNRPYLRSLVGNLIEFLISAGIPISLLFLWHTGQRVRDLLHRSTSVGAAPLFWSFLLLLTALELSGKVRGEVARMWIFLTPGLVLIAAAQAQELARNSRFWPAVLIGCQFLQLVAFPYFLRVHGY
ncbi:MAG: hypothetical protein M3347_13465 [Armatimonadota bacterium]|nr:hypothetical protein [Armatimonadota bacterium]